MTMQSSVYSHALMQAVHPIPGPGQRQPSAKGLGAPVSAGLQPGPAIETDRRPGSGARIRVGIIGATGYVGAELVRLLDRHPFVDIVGARRRRGRTRRADRDRRTPTSPTTGLRDRRGDAAGRRRAVPRPAPRHGRRDRPRRRRGGHRDHRPRARLPAPRPGRLPALVRLRPPRAGAARRRRLRPAGAPPGGAGGAADRAAGDRRLARLLPDDDAARPRARSPGPA